MIYTSPYPVKDPLKTINELKSKKGVIIFEPSSNDDKIIETVTDAGALDIDLQDDGSIEVLSSVDDFMGICDALSQQGLHYLSADLQMIPSTTVPLDFEHGLKVMKLVQSLEDDDDVQNVYSNFDVEDDVMEKIMEALS